MLSLKKDTDFLWRSRPKKKAELPKRFDLWVSQLDIVCGLDRVVFETMYSPKIDENQIKRLYRLRELSKEIGERTTMTAMVREAIENYLIIKESEKKQLDEAPQKRYNVSDARVMHSHQLDSNR